MKIEIDKFSGSKPIVAPHLLPPGDAQYAENIDVDGGDLRAMAAPLKVADAAGTSIVSIAKWKESSTEHWLEFSSDVDVCKGPVSDDSYERVYLTGLSEPRFYANDNITQAGSPPAPAFDQDADYIKLGVPAPTSALTGTGYSTGSIYRAYLYTFVNRYGEEGPPSAILEKTDYGSGNVTLANFATAPSGRAIDKIRVYRTNSAAAGLVEFQVVFATDLMIYSATETYNSGDLVVYNGSLFKCVQNNTTGVTPVGSATEWDDWYDGISDGDLQPDTLVSEDWDPPPASLTGLCALPNGVMAGFVGSTIYMSEPSYPHAWPQGTYSDDFRVQLPHPLVALKVLGSSLVAMTTGPTYMVIGSMPDQMSPVKLPGYYPCLSKRSAADSNMGVFYASDVGLILANNDGLTVTTETLMDRSDWQSYQPSSLAGVFYDGKYIGFYNSEASFVIDYGKKIFHNCSANVRAYHLADDDGILYVAIDDEIDPNNPPATVPIIISKWGASGVESLYFTWESGELLPPVAVNFACARVTVDDDYAAGIQSEAEEDAGIIAYNAAVFAAGDGLVGGLAGVGLNVYGLNGDALKTPSGLSYGSTVTFKLKADGVVKHIQVVSESNVFRLPAGFRSRRYSVSLEGYIPVKKLEVASGMDEIYRE